MRKERRMEGRKVRKKGRRENEREIKRVCGRERAKGAWFLDGMAESDSNSFIGAKVYFCCLISQNRAPKQAGVNNPSTHVVHFSVQLPNGQGKHSQDSVIHRQVPCLPLPCALRLMRVCAQNNVLLIFCCSSYVVGFLA